MKIRSLFITTKLALTHYVNVVLIALGLFLVLLQLGYTYWLDIELSTFLLSPLFMVSVFCYLIIAALIKIQWRRVLSNALSPLENIEQWLDSDKRLPLNSRDNISHAVNQLLKQLNEVKQSHNIEQQMRKQALLDLDTGIGNRAFLTNRLEALLHEEQARGALFLIRLNDFNILQAILGENQSLVLLNQVIQLIKKRLQHFPNYFLARSNEYEIALLVPNAYVNEVEKLADKLVSTLTTIELPAEINKDEFIHIGISCFKENHKTYQILAEADMALRSAQLQGPSQWFMFDAGEIALESAKGSLRWHTFLLSAIKNKSFSLFYQAVIANANEEILHYEVLTKVKEPNGSLIDARIFLPMAQKCGLAIDLDLVIFKQVCQILFNERQNTQLSACYSINLTVETLLSAQFKEAFLTCYANHAEIRQRLIIEVSEYHLVTQLDELLPILMELSQQGVHFVVDKVGQYVVDLDYLKLCPIMAIKLDRSIVLNIDEKLENQIVIQSFNVICQQNNVAMYALGVETQAEWQMLIKLGVQAGQGHFFTSPSELAAKATQVG